MLYPQSNLHRQVIDLSGFWALRFDPLDSGLGSGWQAGFAGGRPVAVPSSWNDQFEEGRDFLGPAWYQTRFDLPWGWNGKRILLRFGSVNYLAEVWLNGQSLGSHEGGHLPFEFDATSLIRPSANLLVVRVDGRLAFDRVPPGNVTGDAVDFFSSHSDNYPQAQFDFFPYCGIQRPVLLYATPFNFLRDLTVRTQFIGTRGRIHVSAQRAGDAHGIARVHLNGHGHHSALETAFSGDLAEAAIDVPDAALWSPSNPDLYDLNIEMVHGEAVIDSYSLKVGIRTIRVDGNRLLLNDQPMYLTGFGRHEDFPIVGRGYLPALIVKDYALMEWIGANSFRTSHYPYSEQMLDLADQLGFLVIDETPAVGLYFREDGLEKRRALCRQYLREMIGRDKNHPSVIIWSLANEPHSTSPHAYPFFEELYQEAKALDQTRPVTLVSFLGEEEQAFEFCDLVCLNRYLGWYAQAGRLDEALSLLSTELDALHQKFGKPILLAEFGADAIPGHHAQPPEMFSEEYQSELLIRYIELLRQKPYVIGEHIWNLCDFKTSQGITRVGALNYKGVFTRDRRPKLAAHRIREVWRKTES
ncbi:MAG TPA: beta-glucuronidase [Anaerolineales bacterium]|nr:beta-glucuronidase [Anaerolineales bacterium]